MFHTYVHIYNSLLHQIQSLIQSLKSNQDCTFCSVFLSFLPILFKTLSVWNACLGCQKIFDCSLAGGAGSFVTGAEAAESFVSQLVDHFVVGDTEGFVAVGIGDFVAEGFLWSGAEGFEGIFLANFVDCHPNPPLCVLHFCKCGSMVPMSIFCGLFGHCHGMGDCCSFGLFFCFDGGGRYAKAVLGKRVPCLTGALEISSSGGGLSLVDLVVGCGTLANCPVASLCIVISIDCALDLTIGVCVLIVATVGVGAVEVGVEGVGWVNTLPLYLLLAIIAFLLLSFTLGTGDFLTLGLVLHWASLCWFCCKQTCCDWIGCSWVWSWVLDLGPSLPSNSMFSFSGQGRGKDRVLCSRDYI